MALLTKFLIWDLFIMYMIICVIFLVSCCVWVSCMFLFYPAKSQHEIRRSKQDINPEGNLKNCSIRSTPIPSQPSIKKEHKTDNCKNCRSKSINVFPLPQCSEHSTENEPNEFSLLAVIESRHSGTEEETKLVKNI